MRDAQRAADEAIDRVDANANERWKIEAHLCGIQMAREHDTFTSSDVAERLAARFPGVKTHDGRAWGSIMKKLRNEGWIASTETYKVSGRATNHNRPQLVWRSLCRNST